MKRIIILFATALLVLASCGKAGESSVAGSWQLASSSVALEEGYDVYVYFGDGSFELYQKFGSERYYSYKGSYSVADGVLSGRYSDGSAWASFYKVSRKGDQLTLTAADTDSEYIYRSADIPDNVKTESVPAI